MFHALTSAAYLGTKLVSFANTAARYSYWGFRLLSTTQSPTMDIQTFKALDDNYMYLIIDKATNEAAFVDPVNPKIIPDILKKNNANLTTVLTTHHHWDHAGGNNQMKKLFPNIKIYGGDERVEAVTDKIKHNDIINLGNLKIQCFSTPCHTSGHICYYIDAKDVKAVFTGDTLFLAGCGRFFEGTAEQMDKNLNDILGNLPPETYVYCGHEYTIKNLQFGLTVEPTNKAISSKLKELEEKKKQCGEVMSVPGTIGNEKLTNVFMRVKIQEVMDHVGETDHIKVMSALRNLKDKF